MWRLRILPGLHGTSSVSVPGLHGSSSVLVPGLHGTFSALDAAEETMKT